MLHAASVPFGWQRLAAETVKARLPARTRRLPAWMRRSPRLDFVFSEEYSSLSYVLDWKDAFMASPLIEPEAYDVNDALALERARRRMARYDLVVVLHSAAGDHLGRLDRLVPAMQGRRGRLLVLFGNEYALMPEKIEFARSVEADLIGTQLPVEAGRWLYDGCPGSTVVAAPAALNPAVYRDLGLERTVDVGFRGDLYTHAFALGDRGRTALLDLFEGRGGEWGLTLDIAYRRLPREEWAEFLNRCLGVLGAESGTAFLERDDATRSAVVAHLEAHPEASFEEVYERFFAHRHESVSGKAISSRHFEAVGTGTCQVLLEGSYNGILEAGRHYLAVKADLSNADEVVRQLRDPEVRAGVVSRARDLVLADHTYDKRVAGLVQAALGLGGQ